MNTRAAICLIGCSFFTSNALIAEDFETMTWPGEGIPVLISSVDLLRIRLAPRLDSDARTIEYRKGWKVPFDKSLYRTTRSGSIIVQRTATVEIYCETAAQYEFEAGEELIYLQYRAEGYVIARVDGKICEVPALIEDDIFGSVLEQPETEWWVRVTYFDGTSPGWLHVTDGQVSFGIREF